MHNRSTNTAFHTFVDEILFNMNNRLLTGVCQLDIRKGFDSVNHEILLHKLEKYGVLDVSLSWFQSYLSSRSQIVKVNGKISNKNFTCIRYADDSSLSSHGRQKPSKRGGDLSREVWHNKGLWYKNNKKYEG